MAGLNSWIFATLLLIGVHVTLAGRHNGNSRASSVHQHHNYYGDVHNHQGYQSDHHDDHHDDHDDDHGDDDDDEEEDTNVYRFRVDNDWPRYSYKNDRGEVVGCNPDLLFKVCRQAHKRCYFNIDVFSNCWSSEAGGRPGWGLMEGWYDACLGVVPTPARRNSFNFTEAFSEPIQWRLHFKGKHDGNLDGVKVGFVDGYAMTPKCLGKNFDGNFEAVTVSSVDEVIEAIASGKVAAFASEDSEQLREDHHLTPHGAPFTCNNEGMAVMAHYGSDVITWWNEAYEALDHHGEHGEFCHQPEGHHHGAPHWNYIGGTTDWPSHFHNCGLNAQSPINIVSQDVETDTSLSTITFHNYDAPLSASDLAVSNNGHTVSVGLSGTDSVYIEGDSLPARYNLLGVHIHFGSTNTQGSEHTVDGTAYPAEVHFVHMKDTYADVPTALAAGDSQALAVVGYFVEIGSNDNADLADFIAASSSVPYHDSRTVLMSPVSLSTLMPTNKDEFYRYAGSLTTPTCDEVVVWTLLKDTVTMSQTQLDALRALHAINSGDSLTNTAADWLQDNFRPPTPLNGRTVYSNAN